MIIDTNTYGALKNGDRNALKLLAEHDSLGVPLPVIAELKHGFVNGSRAAYNQMVLAEFLSKQVVRILYPTLATCDIYADLRLYAQKRGRALSNNDTWIAALAQEDGDTLVTYDKDFAVFQELFGQKLQILS